MVLVSHYGLAACGGRHAAGRYRRRPHCVPKGLRHGYAINALNKGVPLNLLSQWMGHSIMEITAIYANAVGEEQQAITARMWS